MHSDFSTRGRSVRELIPVPTVPLDSIRRRSRAARARGRMRTIVACAAIVIAALGTGAGVGAKIYDRVHVWLSGGRSAIVVHSGVIMRHPIGSELREAIAHATFAVVFPVGLPAGSRVEMVTLAPADRPSAITISYQNGSGFNRSFALLDPAVVSDAAKLPGGPVGIGTGTVRRWQIGGEIVLVRSTGSPAHDLDRIETAMIGSSPRDSLAANEAMLPTMIVLGGTVRLAAAERYRPANGRSVLLEPAFVRLIPGLAKRNAPLLDSRITTLDDVRYAKGDLSGAHLVKRDEVAAVSAGGVRAIDAVLRSGGIGRNGDCACEILFNQPSGTAYWVWNIPLSGPATAKRYSVDARTFVVSRVP